VLGFLVVVLPFFVNASVKVDTVTRD